MMYLAIVHHLWLNSNTSVSILKVLKVWLTHTVSHPALWHQIDPMSSSLVLLPHKHRDNVMIWPYPPIFFLFLCPPIEPPIPNTSPASPTAFLNLRPVPVPPLLKPYASLSPTPLWTLTSLSSLAFSALLAFSAIFVVLLLCVMDCFGPSGLRYFLLPDCQLFLTPMTSHLVTYVPVLTRFFCTILVPSLRFLPFLSPSGTFHSRHQNLLFPSICFRPFPASFTTFSVATGDFCRT